MPIIIPKIISGNSDRIKYLYRMLELLRLEHNAKGKLFKEGKLSETEFRTYQQGEFRDKSDKIFAELNPLKEKMGMFELDSPKKQLKYDGKAETKWDSNIDLKKI
jgi:hypothetical protein